MGIINYIRDTKGELKHVSWPTRKQTIQYTGLVLIISLIITVYLGFFDWLFTKIISTFFI